MEYIPEITPALSTCIITDEMLASVVLLYYLKPAKSMKHSKNYSSDNRKQSSYKSIIAERYSRLHIYIYIWTDTISQQEVPSQNGAGKIQVLNGNKLVQLVMNA